MHDETVEPRAFALRLRAALRARATAGPDGRDPARVEAQPPVWTERSRERPSAARVTPGSAPEVGWLTLTCRWLSALFALVVAVLSLRSAYARTFQDLVGPELAARLDASFEIIASVTLAINVMMLVRRSNVARRLRMSWTLLLVISLYLGGFACLLSRELRSMLYGALSMLAQGVLPDTLRVHVDTKHMMVYLVFALLTMVGWHRWRQELIAVGLLAYGFFLEIVQLHVPERAFSVEDLVANSLGVALGLMTFRTALWAFRPQAKSAREVLDSPRPAAALPCIAPAARLAPSVAAAFPARNLPKLHQDGAGWPLMIEDRCMLARDVMGCRMVSAERPIGRLPRGPRRPPDRHHQPGRPTSRVERGCGWRGRSTCQRPTSRTTEGAASALVGERGARRTRNRHRIPAGTDQRVDERQQSP